MADAQNFKIQTSNYLAYDYREFVNRLRGMALATPSTYVSYRNAVSKKIRDKLVRDWYNEVYSMLVNGTDGAGVILHNDLLAGQTLGPPNFPKQEASKFALGAAATLEKIAAEIIDKLAGIDFDKLSTAQLAKKSSALGL